MEEFKKLSDEELEKVCGGINWDCFGACLLSHGASAIPALSELVKAITDKDIQKVKNLAMKASIASLPIVAQCLNAC